MEINSSSLVNILTLRYDPSIRPNLPTKNSKDFLSNDKPVDVEYFENLICNEIQNKLEILNEKEISIALSGGVDSTLVLALLRKIKPDVKLHAVSIKFANSVDETPAASKLRKDLTLNIT